ncbi:30S ribosomal S17P [Fusarium acutatum]|uniref:30S ribosomal S17P n=1 Tax=Fusarium acutatum TaxID=78861 RepID=A0A8H4NIH8_9HYPO|nr:30S ribosomal S17P [Fusarium acutatum]
MLRPPGDLGDLEEAIILFQQAVDSSPPAEERSPEWLIELAFCFHVRSNATDSVNDDLHSSRIAFEAVSKVQKGDPGYGLIMDYACHFIRQIALRLHDEQVLEQVVEIHKEALDEAIRVSEYIVNDPKDNSEERARYLWLLNEHLVQRYFRAGTLADLDESIKACQKAVDETLASHRDRLKEYFQKGFDLMQEFVSMTGHDDEKRAMRLSNLAQMFREAYIGTGDIQRLERSIRLGRDTLTTIHNDHLHKPIFHFNLVSGLRLRYIDLNHHGDLQEAISFYKLTLYHPEDSIFLRVQAAYDAGVKTIILLSDFRPRSLENADIQREVAKIAGLSTEMACISLRLGYNPVDALELLEMARGVMASSITLLRADLKELKTQFSLELGDEDWGSETSQRHATGDQMSALLHEIRSNPGFENFLRPGDQEFLMSAASLGPVIVVNVYKTLCCAILIHKSRFNAIPLKQLKQDDIDSKYASLGRGSSKVLEWLWDIVAEPILTELGFTEPQKAADMKETGRHSQRNGDTVMDRDLSSYATSVSAIVHSRRTTPVSQNEAVFVPASETPGHGRLAFADREISMLRDVCRRMKVQPVEPQPFIKEVLSHLRNCRIFHVAGHGYNDTVDASKSQLYLKDWQADPFTVASLLELNLHQEGPFLAYLSACGTGQIKSQQLFDEGIHLISAYQLAGIRHVIGTLWEVNDQSCVDMAAIVYEEISKGNMSDDSVCRGVHVATKAKRDQWLDDTYGVGKKKADDIARDTVALDDDDQDSLGIGNRPLYWVPYVHFGA